jgi:hypothetical protein
MTQQIFTVVCKGRGTHKRHAFNTITVTEDGLTCKAIRKSARPDLKGLVVDGLRVPSYVLMRAYNPRHGAAGWRWKCPYCLADKRFSDDSCLRVWLVTMSGRVADISLRS